LYTYVPQFKLFIFLLNIYNNYNELIIIFI